MKIIPAQQIEDLGISPKTCVDWVRDAFLMKHAAQLPPKISLHPQGSDFINTMPCLLPPEYHRFGCKVVSRIKGRVPAIQSEMMLFDSITGELLALINCDWITAMRTGAVATLAINTLRHSHAINYSFIGLGSTGKATLKCLLDTNSDRLHIRLIRYKDHAENIISSFKNYNNVRFSIVDSLQEAISESDVIVSCITDASGLLIEDPSSFKAGTLIVPVHTRGFQNCDTVFDRVFADDTGHVMSFKYFKQFRKFGELGDILSGKIPGRESDQERILSYNIGIGIHDVLFATNIMNILENKNL